MIVLLGTPFVDEYAIGAKAMPDIDNNTFETQNNLPEEQPNEEKSFLQKTKLLNAHVKIMEHKGVPSHNKPSKSLTVIRTPQ